MWESEIKSQLDFLMKRNLREDRVLPFAAFLSMHRTAFTQLQRCHEIVPCQIPDGRALVGYLIDNIECEDHDMEKLHRLSPVSCHQTMINRQLIS